MCANVQKNHAGLLRRPLVSQFDYLNTLTNNKLASSLSIQDDGQKLENQSIEKRKRFTL